MSSDPFKKKEVRIPLDKICLNQVRPSSRTYIDRLKEYIITGTMPEDAGFWEHLFRCNQCELHFTVASEYKEWPNKGTTRDRKIGEATGLVYCPECGLTRYFNHSRRWVAKRFIYQEIGLEIKGAEIITIKPRPLPEAPRSEITFDPKDEG